MHCYYAFLVYLLYVYPNCTYCTCILSVLTVRAFIVYLLFVHSHCTCMRTRGSISSMSLTNQPDSEGEVEGEGEGEMDSDVEVEFEIDFRAAMSSPEGFPYPEYRGVRRKEVEEGREGE